MRMGGKTKPHDVDVNNKSWAFKVSIRLAKVDYSMYPEYEGGACWNILSKAVRYSHLQMDVVKVTTTTYFLLKGFESKQVD